MDAEIWIEYSFHMTMYYSEFLPVNKNIKIKQSLVAHADDLRTWDSAEVGGARVEVKPGLRSESEANLSYITRSGLKLQ